MTANVADLYNTARKIVKKLDFLATAVRAPVTQPFGLRLPCFRPWYIAKPGRGSVKGCMFGYDVQHGPHLRNVYSRTIPYCRSDDMLSCLLTRCLLYMCSMPLLVRKMSQISRLPLRSICNITCGLLFNLSIAVRVAMWC